LNFKIFVQFDEDLDRFLNKKEFYEFLTYLNPILNDKDKESIFKLARTNNSEKVNFKEFKQSLQNIILICRIKDVFVDLKKLNILNQ
jgi:Ca2+-binding EF-hand superfamily protein